MESAKNILLMRLKSMGDVILTLPAVHAVREHFPKARITFLTSKENLALVDGFRDVNAVISLDRARFQSGNPVKILAESFTLFRRLRQEKISLVVDFQGYGETAWLTRLTGAPQRWGSVYVPGRRWAYTRGVTRNDRIHSADWNLSLLEQCEVPAGRIFNEFVLPDGALNEARQFFVSHDLDIAKPTLFIQPFTSTLKKNWPLDRYLTVARHWQQRGMQILFGGGPAERTALEPVRQAGFTVSAGVPLLVTGGLMKLSSLILGGDTGALHLAVAMGKRVIMIMKSIAPGSPHPFQHPDWTVVPMNRGAVASIEIAVIIEAGQRALVELNTGKIR